VHLVVDQEHWDFFAVFGKERLVFEDVFLVELNLHRGVYAGVGRLEFGNDGVHYQSGIVAEMAARLTN